MSRHQGAWWNILYLNFGEDMSKYTCQKFIELYTHKSEYDCKLELNKPDLVKELQSTKIFYKNL